MVECSRRAGSQVEVLAGAGYGGVSVRVDADNVRRAASCGMVHGQPYALVADWWEADE